jgi:membrane protein
VLFLAGGIAFNLLLAALPFVLLLATGLTFLLPIFFREPVNSSAEVAVFIHRLLPAHAHGPECLPPYTASSCSPIDKLVGDLLRTRRSVTIYSAIGFVWFSTRLFGSLRTVLASVFDIESERGIIAGKIFDVKITIVSTLLFVASVTVSTYVALATHNGVTALETLGLRKDVMGNLEAWIGRALAFAFIALMFFALYKYLPIRRVRTKTAWVAAAFTSFAFEAARTAFAYYTQTFNPATLYTGAVTAIIVVVVWFYYAALIFILGGEVGQVFQLRRMRREQREVFTD